MEKTKEKKTNGRARLHFYLFCCLDEELLHYYYDFFSYIGFIVTSPNLISIGKYVCMVFRYMIRMLRKYNIQSSGSEHKKTKSRRDVKILTAAAAATKIEGRNRYCRICTKHALRREKERTCTHRCIVQCAIQRMEFCTMSFAFEIASFVLWIIYEHIPKMLKSSKISFHFVTKQKKKQTNINQLCR